MPRGKASPAGTESIAQNGYTWVKQEDGSWKYKHVMIAEVGLGRKIDQSREWVYFKDRNKRNFDPDNIEVRPVLHRKAKKSLQIRAQVRKLRQDLDSLQTRLEDIERELDGESEYDLTESNEEIPIGTPSSR